MNERDSLAPREFHQALPSAFNRFGGLNPGRPRVEQVGQRDIVPRCPFDVGILFLHHGAPQHETGHRLHGRAAEWSRHEVEVGRSSCLILCRFGCQRRVLALEFGHVERPLLTHHIMVASLTTQPISAPS